MSIQLAIDECKKFQTDHADDLAQLILLSRDSNGGIRMVPNASSLCGYLFWLTRNHHGSGFWDGDFPDDVGERLTQASHAYSELELVIGDDGLLYLE